MLLLEGVDKCGKTTLAAKLRKSLPGWSYRGHTRPPLSCGFSAYQYFSWFLADTHPRVISDRLHLSTVYQEVFTPEHTLTQHQWKMIELACLKNKTRVIYMEDELDAIEARWDEKEMFKPDTIGQLQEHFAIRCKMTKLPLIKQNLLDYIQGLSEWGIVIPPDCLSFYEREAEEASKLPSASIGTGTTGGIMYVGESISDKQIQKNYVGQLPFSIGPASMFLWDALDKAGIPWEWGYYTNADEFSYRGMCDLIRLVKPQLIVCLGNHASRALDGITISPKVNIKHPMAAMRFGGIHALKGYASELRQNIKPDNIDKTRVWGRDYGQT